MNKIIKSNNILYKSINYLLVNYWWFMLLSGVTLMFHHDLFVSQLYFAVGLVLCGWVMLNLNKNVMMDKIVIIYLGYMLCHALFDDYPNHALGVYRSIQNEFTFVLFYFVGRKLCFQDYGLFRGMKWPLIISMIAGLYFFFYQPDYYMANKGTRLTEYSTISQIQEAFRLSSFWPSPYNISYALGCFSPFLWYSFFNNRKDRYIIGLIVLSGVTLLFAQMRVIIFGFLMSGIMMFIFYAKKSKTLKVSRHVVLPIFVCLIFYWGYSTILNTVSGVQSTYLVEHMLSLTKNEDLNSRFEHTSSSLNDITVFGDGWGLYSQVVQGIDEDKNIILDFGYAGILAELGLVGLGLYLLIMLTSLLKAVKNWGVFQVEICIVLLFLIAMWGASANNHMAKSPHIYWFCIGAIWSGKEKLKGVNNFINNSKL